MNAIKPIEDLIRAVTENAKNMQKAAQEQHWDLFESLANKHQELWPSLAENINTQNQALLSLENTLRDCATLASSYQQVLGKKITSLNLHRKADDAYRGT